MGNLRKSVLVGLVSAAFVLGAAPSALAHGDEHDVHRVASGAAGTFDVSVWAADVPTETGLVPVTISVTPEVAGAGPDAVRLETTSAAGVIDTVDATTSDGAGQWYATIQASGGQPTSVVVTVIDGAQGSELGFVYTTPGSTWWMKLIITAALAHGALCAVWMLGRRQRAFRRITGAPVVATV